MNLLTLLPCQCLTQITFTDRLGVLPTSSTSAEDGGSLIPAGQNRLAFVFNEDEFDGAGGSGTLNIISGVPTGGTTTAVPEPSSLALIMVVGGFLVTRRQRVSV